MSSVTNSKQSNAGRMIDASVAGYAACSPEGWSKTAAATVTVANQALDAGNHRTTGTWVAQGDHRSVSQWVQQGNHRTVSEWAQGQPSRNKKN